MASNTSVRLDSFTRVSERPEKYLRAVLDWSLKSLSPHAPGHGSQYLPTRRQRQRDFKLSCSLRVSQLSLLTVLIEASYQAYRPSLARNFWGSTDTSFNAASTPTSMMGRLYVCPPATLSKNLPAGSTIT